MEKDIGFLIFRIKQLSDRLFNRLLAEKGLAQYNGAQGRILMSLWNEGPESIRELSQRFFLAPAALTAMLDHLANQRLIKRTQNVKNRRMIAAKASAKSLELKAGFSPDEEKKLRGELFQLKGNIQNQGDKRWSSLLFATS